MKNSSSSSSSSSTTTVTTPYQTRFSAAPGFFASMLRRLFFCSNSLPTPPPSNHLAADADDNLYGMSAPCLVARLMGLDYLPPPPADTASSITKSWSLNSQGSLSRENNDSSRASLQREQRFEPNYAEFEDDHFFILSFEKKFRSKKGDRSKLGYGKLKPRNQERWKVYPNEDPYEKKVDVVVDEAESDSDRSPVSVLDIDEFGTASSDLSTPVNETEETDIRELSSKSIRKLSKNFKLLLTSPRTNLVISKKRKMWNEIGRISEEDMTRSRWDYGEASKLQEFEEIGYSITDILLNQLLLEEI